MGHLSFLSTIVCCAICLVSGQTGTISNFAFPDCTKPPLSTNAVCDTSKDVLTRATAIVNLFTPDELMNNTINTSPGVPRLGLPAYQWWSEALHGFAYSFNVTLYNPSGDFSSATSFPQPILMSAAFDDDLIEQVATVVSTEARAFNNVGKAGLDYWTPNINPFKDPRWGRGQETPGEDPFRIQGYVNRLVRGLQGGLGPELPYLKVVSTCKHFSGYDLENWEGNLRYGFNAIISDQDLVEYYLPPFKACVRDAKVETIMCSYNAINGIPACADEFMNQNILRDLWGLPGWIVSDCDAVMTMQTNHNFTQTLPEAAAVALNAGTDINCGFIPTAYSYLPAALNSSLTTVKQLQTSLIRQYSTLIRLGYFDPADNQPFRKLGASDVNTPASQALAKQAAVDGIVLLKNDGILPLRSTKINIAIIGPWANATTQMQGNYQGKAPFLISPFQGFQDAGFQVTFSMGTTTTSSNDTTNFGGSIAVAKAADLIVFAGGLDETIETEGMDRLDISWPTGQFALIQELAGLKKPLVVLQFGGGQVDNTWLKNNSSVNAILWGGYPGQSGGAAIVDILVGKSAPAGRLPVTQYPAAYTSQIPMTDMTLRPSASSPGRTYSWYQGQPVYPFGSGLHYTTFSLSWARVPSGSSSIQSIMNGANSKAPLDTQLFEALLVNVKNTGKVTSDFVTMVYLVKKAGPPPFPNSQLVSYTRVKSLRPGETRQVQLPVSIGSVARVDDLGNLVLHPGSYEFSVDVPTKLKASFTLVGQESEILKWPQRPSKSS